MDVPSLHLTHCLLPIFLVLQKALLGRVQAFRPCNPQMWESTNSRFFFFFLQIGFLFKILIFFMIGF